MPLSLPYVNPGIRALETASQQFSQMSWVSLGRVPSHGRCGYGPGETAPPGLEGRKWQPGALSSCRGRVEPPQLSPG